MAAVRMGRDVRKATSVYASMRLALRIPLSGIRTLPWCVSYRITPPEHRQTDPKKYPKNGPDQQS